MKISDILSMCFRNLWRRKVRTFLTVLGVVIGSCAIVVMISLGLGSNAALEYSLGQMGELNVVTVYGGQGGVAVMSSNGTSSASSNEPMTLNDEAVQMIQQIDGVTAVFPKLNLSQWNWQAVSLYAGKNNRYIFDSEMYGIYPEALEKFGYKVAEGSIPSDGTQNFIIFGSDAAYQFRDTKKNRNNRVWKEQKSDGTFMEPFFDPMDQTFLLTVNNTKKDRDDKGNYPSGGRGYEYKMTAAAILEQDYNKYDGVYSIMMDMGLVKKLVTDYNRLNGVKDAKEPVFTGLSIWVDDLEKVGDVQDAVTEMGFQASSMDSIRDQLQGQVVKQQLLLGSLAAISLFVAAIGITNTMIMSIYERTREIGIMKVLGCFIVNIRQIFLIEASCIGFFGGVVGSIISVIISIVLNAFGGGAIGVEMYFGDTGQSVPISIIPFWLILLALAFSTVIGLISGFSPANRAVKISALEAIKNDG